MPERSYLTPSASPRKNGASERGSDCIALVWFVPVCQPKYVVGGHDEISDRIVATAPQGLSATPGDGQVSLSWSAPASDGGGALASYRVYRDGSLVHTTANGATVTFTDTGRTNGQQHRYAVNAAGEGPSSAEASATPLGPPDVTDPTVDLSTPPDGAIYHHDQVVAADFSCADEVGGSGVDTCVGNVADGNPVDTSTLGSQDFTVTATDNAGSHHAVTHTYTVAQPQADGRIKRGATGAYQGDNVYNATGAGQTRTGSAGRGGTVTYYMSAQNDAPFPDQLRLKGTASNARFTVSYATGGSGITSGVTGGTFTTPVLAPGATLVVKITVTAATNAPAGSSLSATLITRSNADLTRKDTVKFVTNRA